MPAVPVRIQISARIGPHDAVCSAILARSLNVGAGTQVALRLGSRAWTVTVHVTRAAGARLWLPPTVAGALNLPGPMWLWARRTDGETQGGAAPGGAAPAVLVDLGPVVGILAVQRHNTNRLFLAAARTRGVLAYLFTPHDVLWEEGVVWGRLPAGRRWVRRPCPWPHVVFDRAVGLPQPDCLAGFWRELAVRGTSVFNGDLGDKWRLHRHLSAYEELRPHLPETLPLDGETTLRAMLARWGTVYVKPAGGYMGRGIVQITPRGRGWWRMASTARSGPRLVADGALGAALAPLFRGGYIVQQGLDLVRIGGSVCDVRVLALKDGHGRWRMAGVTVRCGRPGRIAANLHQGGRPLPLGVLARRVPGPPGAPSLKGRILMLVERVLRAVETVAPLAGDVGVDIGVDRLGRLWIIEVNTKPGRSGKPTRPAVYALPMDYARSLAGFGPGVGAS